MRLISSFCSLEIERCVVVSSVYRVTRLEDLNLLLTSKQKFRFNLARSGQGRLIRNFCCDVNGRFESRRCVTRYNVTRLCFV